MHKHWIILAFDEKQPHETIKGAYYRIKNDIEISLDAESEEEVLKKVKDTVKRNFYDVIKVYLCDRNHQDSQDLRDEALVLQLEMQKQLLKKL